MTERPNIRRMQMPESAHSEALEFDPKRDISAQDWQHLRQMVIDYARTGKWAFVAYYTALEKDLDPKQTSDIAPEHWTRILEKWDEVSADMEKLEQNLDLMRGIALLKPGAIDTERHRDELRSLLDRKKLTATSNAKFDEEWRSVAYIAAQLEIIYPDQEWITDSDWAHMSRKLSKLRQEKDYDRSFYMASYMRILRDDPAVLPDQAEWQAFKNNLAKKRTDDIYPTFCMTASSAKILAAGKITVTERGIEYTARKSISKEPGKDMPATIEI